MKLFLFLCLLVPWPGLVLAEKPVPSAEVVKRELFVVSATDFKEWFIGKWVAQSTGTMAVHGDMEIRNDSIYWNRHGWIKYKVVSETKSYVLVEFERPLNCRKGCEKGCGKVVRFGPYPEAQSRDSLQMSEYPSLEHATSNNGDDLWKPGACAWGWYLR